MKYKKMELPNGWYPKDKNACESAIQEYLQAYKNIKLVGEWIGGIVPHAGWYYSGKLACEVIYLLSQREKPDVIAVFGGHLRPDDFPTYSDYESFETPFGNIECHITLFNKVISEMKNTMKVDYAIDNTVEIQLPFIKYFFPNTKLIAFRSPPSQLAITLGKTIAENAKSEGLKIKFLGSTDLTHYGPNYSFMPKGTGSEAVKWVKGTNDKHFINLLQSMEGELAIKHSLENSSACSSGGAASCLTASKVFGNKTCGEIIDYYTSYDISKNSSFVGYLGMVF